MKPLLFAALLVAPLAACAPAPAPQPVVPAGDCAAPYQGLVGTKIAASLLPATLNHRVILPGMAVTQDYNAERVNFYIDKGSIIQRVTCG